MQCIKNYHLRNGNKIICILSLLRCMHDTQPFYTLNRWQNCCNRQQTIQGQEKLSMIAPYHVYAYVVLRLQRAEMFMTPALKNMCIWLSATVGLPIRNPLKRYGTALHKVYCNAQYDVFESHTNRSGVHNLQVHCSTLVMETSPPKLHLFLQKPYFTV